MSPDGRTLYVNESRVGTVGAFAINYGGLSPSSLARLWRFRPVFTPLASLPPASAGSAGSAASSRRLFRAVSRAGSILLPALARFWGSMARDRCHDDLSGLLHFSLRSTHPRGIESYESPDFCCRDVDAGSVPLKEGDNSSGTDASTWAVAGRTTVG